MSTRRARIKAITSLPVRRKNVENGDNSKNKQAAKERNVIAPKSPRVSIINQEDQKISDPASDKIPSVIKPATPVPEDTPSVISVLTPKDSSHPSTVQISARETPTSTPQRAEKVSVITPNLNYKPISSNNLPLTINDFASPAAPSPKVSKPVAVVVERPETPVKGKTPSAHTIDENNELQITSNNVNSVLYNRAPKSVLSDDYNVPSVPESVVENDGVMDGIVPLQAESNAPKPIDLLKNEIISENAEVLFDPIIPLPSPSKVRPKLRPTPRLGIHRRNSIQGSASESEDESRRAHLGGGGTPVVGRQRRDSHTSFSTLNSVPHRDVSRTRNDSVCSSVSQVGGQVASSPVKEKSTTKSRRREVSRRMAAARRRRETVQRDTLTMYDLIFYNPTTNPIPPNQDELKAKVASIKEEEQRLKNKEEKKEIEKRPAAAAADAAPVPQLTLGPDGEIILDKSSLVINQTDANREVSTVHEGSWGGGSGRYTRTARTADWSACETVRFYRALAAIGTDFSLMAQLFPDRTRREIKLKFKKEERINGAQVDKALRMGNSWDPNRLKQEFQAEREAALKKAAKDAERMKMEKERERERVKRSRLLRVRNSRATRALQSTMLPGVSKRKPDDIETAEDIVNRALLKKKRSKHITDETPSSLKEPIPPSSMATLTLINKGQPVSSQPKVTEGMATISRISTPSTTPPLNLNSMPNLPANIETGSLVVLTVNDPSSPSKKMLQTYIAHSAGRLTPVSLPPMFLNSVVGYMKKGTPKSTVSSNSSPQFTSPGSVVSQDSRGTPVTSGDSPVKRKRISSYTITQL